MLWWHRKLMISQTVRCEMYIVLISFDYDINTTLKIWVSMKHTVMSTYVWIKDRKTVNGVVLYKHLWWCNESALCEHGVIADLHRSLSYLQSGLCPSHAHIDAENTLQQWGGAAFPVATGQKIDHPQWHTTDSIWSPCCCRSTFTS